MTDQCTLDINGNLKSPSKINFYHNADDNVPMAGPEAAPEPQTSVINFEQNLFTVDSVQDVVKPGDEVHSQTFYTFPQSSSLIRQIGTMPDCHIPTQERQVE
ncbi:hypothetical protein EDD18DRAFT_1107486 [Armillaria luteobubalina]|uniref:Uncharacterized protein n=1 Tax=Armillaria luteobubalina TaxID=153913 RepID=A0AA39Q2C0_9AGAR|nr:hypothetical protein EDD18DRAFT_1107486 [Armillaria luteobubalina]